VLDAYFHDHAASLNASEQLLALAESRAVFRADIAEVTRRWQSGDLRTVVHATYPLTDVVRIHETLDARANLGRLIATT